MSHFTVDQLPTPSRSAPCRTAPAAGPRWSPTPDWRIGRRWCRPHSPPASSAGCRPGRRWFRQLTRHPVDDRPSGTDGAAGNGSLTRQELAAAYSATFGVAASDASLDCVAGRMGGTGSQAERLARGEMLTLAEAEEAFTPFMTCAPDADFLALMVPAAVQALGGQADQACITDGFLTFGVAGRSEAHGAGARLVERLRRQRAGHVCGLRVLTQTRRFTRVSDSAILSPPNMTKATDS